MSTTTTDPIADMLARMRNAIAVHKAELSLPHSNVKQRVAEILKDNGFIDDVKVTDLSIGKSLHIVLNSPLTTSKITAVRRLSTPGRRSYVSAAQIPVVMRGRGIVVVSTSQGLLTGKEAQKRGIGGELICEVY